MGKEKVIKYSDLKHGMYISLDKDSKPAYVTEPRDKMFYDDQCLGPGDFGFVNGVGLSYVSVEVININGNVHNQIKYIQNRETTFKETDPTAYKEAKRKLWAKIGLPTSYTGKWWTMGSDPEIFVVDKNNVVIPAWEFLPSKEEAFKDGSLDLHSAIPFWDGFQAEFAVRPSVCHEELVTRIRRGLQFVLWAAKKKYKDAKLTHLPVVDIPKKLMDETSYEHAALGCAPSTNIYKNVRGLRVEDPKNLPFRFAGCHIHMGCVFKDENREQRETRYERIVKSIDSFFGIMSVSMLQGLEDVRRRKFYGMAGEFRTPKHGIEYRVGSSAILIHPIVTFLAFDLARLGAKLASDEMLDIFWNPPEEEDVKNIINDLDVKAAQKVINKNEVFVRKALTRLYNNSGNKGGIVDKVYNMLLNGVKDVFGTDIEKNWSLNENYWSTTEVNCRVMNMKV